MKVRSKCYPYCNIPDNMELPVYSEKVEAYVQGVTKVSCNQSTVLLSCGLDNIDTTANDFYR